MPLISVIVPVYKVETYLPACVDSILSQTFSDFELILVDDGSPDACGAMCDGYAREDSRIRVIHQKNGGLSAARNAGLDIAKGEYVTFVDSDDVIMRDYLRELYLAIIKNDAEVACCKFQNFEDDKPDIESAKSISKVHVKVMTGHEAVLSIYNATGEVSVNAYGKLFMMKLFVESGFLLESNTKIKLLFLSYCVKQKLLLLQMSTVIFIVNDREVSCRKLFLKKDLII